MPLNQLGERELCPGAVALEKFNAAALSMAAGRGFSAPATRALPMRQLACLLVMFALASPASAQQRTGGPYVPTPQAVVDEMLRLANVHADDVVVDLGSGDGRIVLTAAQPRGARFRPGNR